MENIPTFSNFATFFKKNLRLFLNSFMRGENEAESGTWQNNDD